MEGQRRDCLVRLGPTRNAVAHLLVSFEFYLFMGVIYGKLAGCHAANRGIDQLCLVPPVSRTDDSTSQNVPRGNALLSRHALDSSSRYHRSSLHRKSWIAKGRHQQKFQTQVVQVTLVNPLQTLANPL